MNQDSAQFWTTWVVRLGIIAFGGYLAGKGVNEEEQNELFGRVAEIAVAGAMIVGGVAWSWYQRSRHKEAKDTLKEIATDPGAMKAMSGETFQRVRKVTKVTI